MMFGATVVTGERETGTVITRSGRAQSGATVLLQIADHVDDPVPGVLERGGGAVEVFLLGNLIVTPLLSHSFGAGGGLSSAGGRGGGGSRNAATSLVRSANWVCKRAISLCCRVICSCWRAISSFCRAASSF